MSAKKSASPAILRLLRLRDLQRRVPLARSTIYKKIAVGAFPPPIALGPRAVGWLESDVEGWIRARARLCRSATCVDDLTRENAITPVRGRQ